MKYYCLSLFISLSLSFTSSAQHIDTLEVIPQNPTIHDSVLMRRAVVFPYWDSSFHYDSISLTVDSIYIFSCLKRGVQTAVRIENDTFSLGKLTAGQYYIEATNYYTFDQNTCVPIDTAYRTFSFTVIDDIGLEENILLGAADVYIFPNPTSNMQQLQITSPTPRELQIDLHDLAGKKVLSVYDGLSVQGQQSFEVDLRDLLPGVYLYQVYVGEEAHHLRVIKQ